MTQENQKKVPLLVSIGKECLWFVALLSSGTLLGGIAVYFFSTPDIASLEGFPLHLTTILYDRTGTHELYRLYDEENRISVPHDQIADTVRLATVASEDASFYSHNGINPLAILRALKVNLESGKTEQGGSTITQQLARTLFLSREKTLNRKIREAFLAVKIDAHVSKDDILDLYLNAIPYGANAYGIEAAAQTYFHKSARDLSLDESALLAALPNAPTYYSPYHGHRAELIERQKNILAKMFALHSISQQELDTALHANTLSKIAPYARPIVAPHFVFYILDELEKKYSEEDLRTSGLRVITSIDLELQKAAEEAVARGAEKNLSRGASNAALVALDARNGEVLAMVGSKDYFNQSIDGNVNVTLRARQPGSAFKPFAYAKAFEKGFQPETPIWDRPINFGPDGSGKNYIPSNYDGRFHGHLTMRQALSMSLNVPAVQTLALAGVPETIELAQRLGITTLTDPKRYGLALVLGGAEVKPIDMAHAFSVFSQEGIAHDIAPFISITERDGQAASWGPTDHRQEPTGKRVLDTQVARKINSILSDNPARTPIFGANSPLAFPPGVEVAAKTGTTQNFRDAWTVGYTGAIAVAVWAGNNDNRPMAQGADGIYVAAPLWRDFMNSALKKYPATHFTAYTPSPTLSTALALQDTQGINTNQNKSSKIIYFDKKTGREISETKAKKLSPSRVVKNVVFDQAGSPAPSQSPAPENEAGLVSWDQVKSFYKRSP